jgi:diaminopimelate decarboxylase
LGLHAGYDPEKIFYTPNGISRRNEEVHAMGVQIISITFLYTRTIWYKTPTCSRMYYQYVMAGGNTNISVGHIDSKFGISIHQLPHLVRIVENTKMNI